MELNILEKVFSDSARAASAIARAKQAAARAAMGRGAKAYVAGKSGERGAPRTPGQVEGKEYLNAVGRNLIVGRKDTSESPADRRLRIERDSLLRPGETRASVRSKVLTLDEAIRTYGFEDPRTIAAARREEGQTRASVRKTPDLREGFARVEREVSLAIRQKHQVLAQRIADGVRTSDRVAREAVLTGNPARHRLLQIAEAFRKAQADLETKIQAEIAEHPKLKAYAQMAANYKGVA